MYYDLTTVGSAVFQQKNESVYLRVVVRMSLVRSLTYSRVVALV